MGQMIYSIFVIFLVATLLAVTILPITDSKLWWIRAMDFPRLQLIVIAAVIAVLCWWLTGWAQIIALAIVLGCGLFQAWYVYPFSPLGRKEIRLAPDGPDQIKLLASNVLMENEEYQKVRDLIEREDPDILFLMETDQKWLDAMEPALTGYGTVIREPRDNYYGLIFATRLPVTDARVVYIADNETPTLFAEMRGPEGKTFRFVGLHPKPPVPGEDTEERDAQIAYVARFARKSDVPVVIMGDFNDAAWGHLAQRFKSVGQYLDPRLGRGPLPSFDANAWLMRFPIDQLYITEDMALVDYDRGPNIGSDHFPMIARIRVDRELAATLNSKPKPLPAAEKKLIEAQLLNYTKARKIDPLGNF